MSPTHFQLGILPPEILLRILSFFDLDDIRELRNVIAASYQTNHQDLYAAAVRVLQDRRTWLLNRWQKVHENTPVLEEAPPGIELIAERIIGKQFARENEIMSEGDQWVSVTTICYFGDELMQ